MTFLLRYWPYIAIVLLTGLLWGGWGYLKSARQDAAQATTRAEAAESSLASLKLKKAADEALLAQRESDLITARRKIAAQHRAITEFQPNEDCLALDTAYDWLNGLLPGRVEVQPPGDRVPPDGS